MTSQGHLINTLPPTYSLSQQGVWVSFGHPNPQIITLQNTPKSWGIDFVLLLTAAYLPIASDDLAGPFHQYCTLNIVLAIWASFGHPNPQIITLQNTPKSWGIDFVLLLTAAYLPIASDDLAGPFHQYCTLNIVLAIWASFGHPNPQIITLQNTPKSWGIDFVLLLTAAYLPIASDDLAGPFHQYCTLNIVLAIWASFGHPNPQIITLQNTP